MYRSAISQNTSSWNKITVEYKDIQSINHIKHVTSIMLHLIDHLRQNIWYIWYTEL